MNKTVLISIKPKWVAKILNGEKTIEIRKTAPKCTLPIDVYIYCTKTIRPISDYDWGEFTFDDLPKLGKVVAKFTLRKVEKITKRKIWGEMEVYGEHTDFIELDRKTCLKQYEIADYMGRNCHAYAWHIEDLVIFDKPVELDEFDYPNPSGTVYVSQRSLNGLPSKKRPPQSWCYVEERK